MKCLSEMFSKLIMKIKSMIQTTLLESMLNVTAAWAKM